MWQHAKIVVGAEMIHCMVRDISATGAMLEFTHPVHLPETFDLYIAAHDLRIYRACLRWCEDKAVGVCFLPEPVAPFLAGSIPTIHPV